MTGKPGTRHPAVYIMEGGYGHRNHLAVSDGREFRYSLCGLRVGRNSVPFKRYKWHPFALKDEAFSLPPVTCRACVMKLTGKEELE